MIQVSLSQKYRYQLQPGKTGEELHIKKNQVIKRVSLEKTNYSTETIHYYDILVFQ